MKNWFKVFFLFFVLGVLVYFNSLNNKFLMDDFVFLKNPVLSQTKFIFSQWNPYREQALGVLDGQVAPQYYRPMAHMALNICYSLFKNNYWQYHLFNLLLFVFASSLIYLFVLKLTGNNILAFLTGLYYLIHPINGILVNYISACVFSFQVIFMLAAMLLLLASLENKNDRTFYFLSLLFSFLSLFWHENGIMTPFYICAVILLFRKDTLKQKIFYLIPFFLISFSYLIFRLNFLGNHDFISKGLNLYHTTVWVYGAELFQVYGWYISKLFFPHGIVLQWVAPVLYEQVTQNVLGLCLWLMLFLFIFIRFTKEKILQMAIIWTAIGFAPVLGSVAISSNNSIEVEPHWFIFSSIGFFILIAYFSSVLLGRIRKVAFVLLFALIITWASVSHAYNQLWADQKTYALYSLQQDPYLKSTYSYLASAYQVEGDWEDSKKYYKMALSMNPSDMTVYYNLGAIEQAEGHFKEAESYCRKVLKINPYSAYAYNTLGDIYYTEGQLDKARENFERSLTFNPLLIEPRYGLALIYFKSSEYQKAASLCLTDLDIQEDDLNSLFLLIDIYVDNKDLGNLRKYAGRVLHLETDPEILTKLGVLLAKNNVFDLALDCFKKVLQVTPGDKDVYIDEGTLLANLGQYDQAIHLWELGSKIDPSDQRFKDNIAKAKAIEGQMTRR